jgi:hypothetical protein
MALTIAPTVAVVNAETKPYDVALAALADFLPSYYVWYDNGKAVHSGTSYTVVPGGYRIGGPQAAFPADPRVIHVDCVHAVGGAIESDEYTTDDQRPPPSLTVVLTEQKNGVPITDLITQPTTPVTAGVPGTTDIDLTWTPEASGRPAQADIAIEVDARDEADLVDWVRIEWGDGQHTDVECVCVSRAVINRAHTYVATTGNITITGTLHDSAGLASAAGTLGVVIPTTASRWRASQYRIGQYQNQMGFREISVVGWRGITDSSFALTFSGLRPGQTYYHKLQLRETDVTGRPVSTSAESLTASAGPW